MRIKDRETVFNKFGGKCAYCGEELQKGWHVDEMEPVIRNRKAIPAGWYHKVTKEHRSIFDIDKKTNTIKIDMFLMVVFIPKDCWTKCLVRSCNINKHSGTLEEFREAIMGI
jgi:hypothetical protein